MTFNWLAVAELWAWIACTSPLAVMFANFIGWIPPKHKKTIFIGTVIAGSVGLTYIVGTGPA